MSLIKLTSSKQKELKILTQLFFFFRIFYIPYNRLIFKEELIMENEQKIIYYIENLQPKKEKWYKKLKDKTVWSYHKARVFVSNHWVEIIIYTPLAVGAAMSVLKFGKALIPHKSVAEQEMDMRNFTFYDRHSNMRFDLNRKLSNAEKISIMDRTGEGERIDEVLKDMRVLKK